MWEAVAANLTARAVRGVGVELGCVKGTEWLAKLMVDWVEKVAGIMAGVGDGEREGDETGESDDDEEGDIMDPEDESYPLLHAKAEGESGLSPQRDEDDSELDSEDAHPWLVMRASRAESSSETLLSEVRSRAP